ncbi:MAG: 30S ribosomal protein S19 [Nanoarchaeota archaeon]|nr:30S ribosomal protein S19 [Nanoarchaeota archaeon]
MVLKFKFHGKTIEELKKMELKEFIELLPSNKRRSIKRGFTEAQKKLLKKINKTLEGTNKKPIKTHCRSMITLPNMVGLVIHIHRGKEFIPVKIEQESLGLRLGELVLTRKKVEHSAPGVGATKSSTAISAR